MSLSETKMATKASNLRNASISLLNVDFLQIAPRFLQREHRESILGVGRVPKCEIVSAMARRFESRLA